MRVILCGKGGAALHALKIMIQNGDEVLVVPVNGDTGEDTWQFSLRKYCEEVSVRHILDKKIKINETIRHLKAFNPDVLISVQYDQIFSKDLLEGIGCPAYNFHYALLPNHRGVAPIPWAIIDGDTEVGVSIHAIVPGIDEGAIFGQEVVKVDASTTAGSAYEAVESACCKLFEDFYPFKNMPQPCEQDGPSQYHKKGDLDFSNLEVDWDRPAIDVHRWIRAMIFPPVQLPYFTVDGIKYEICSIRPLIHADENRPGEVIQQFAWLMAMGTQDGVITLSARRIDGTT